MSFFSSTDAKELFAIIGSIKQKSSVNAQKMLAIFGFVKVLDQTPWNFGYSQYPFSISSELHKSWPGVHYVCVQSIYFVPSFCWRGCSLFMCVCVYYAKQTQKMVYCSSKSVSKPVTHDKITATCRIAIYHWYWYYKQILLRTGKHSVLVTNLLKTRKTKYKHTRTLTLKWTPNGSFTRVQINVHHKSCSHDA